MRKIICKAFRGKMWMSGKEKSRPAFDVRGLGEEKGTVDLPGVAHGKMRGMLGGDK